MLYKKRECERRKRLRIKLEKEREIERQGGPANILLSMVDACEVCRKLYVTVNLFWGVTLCDSCYFNKDVIDDIMKKKNDLVEEGDDERGDGSVSNSHLFKVASHKLAIAEKTKNVHFFTLPEERKKVPARVLEDSPEIIVREDTCPSLGNIDFFGRTFEDTRPVSDYVSPPNLQESDVDEDSDEEFIHEEISNGEWTLGSKQYHFEGSMRGVDLEGWSTESE
jgi:hypothetical protein